MNSESASRTGSVQNSTAIVNDNKTPKLERTPSYRNITLLTVETKEIPTTLKLRRTKSNDALLQNQNAHLSTFLEFDTLKNGSIKALCFDTIEQKEERNTQEFKLLSPRKSLTAIGRRFISKELRSPKSKLGRSRRQSAPSSNGSDPIYYRFMGRFRERRRKSEADSTGEIVQQNDDLAAINKRKTKLLEWISQTQKALGSSKSTRNPKLPPTSPNPPNSPPPKKNKTKIFSVSEFQLSEDAKQGKRFSEPNIASPTLFNSRIRKPRRKSAPAFVRKELFESIAEEFSMFLNNNIEDGSPLQNR